MKQYSRHNNTFSYGGEETPTYNLWRVTLRALAITCLALVMSETIVYCICGLFALGQFGFPFWTTAAVTIGVALPISYYFSIHRFKYAKVTAALEQLSRYDELSGLFNRATFTEATQISLNADGDNSTPAALLFLDADHFKKLNDTFGHAVGDKGIELIGKAIVQEIRATDFAGRLGGEEFAVFLYGASKQEAIKIADRIRANIRDSSRFLEGGAKLSASIGVATRRKNDTCDQLLVRADMSLYEAKTRGRDQVVINDRLEEPLSTAA